MPILKTSSEIRTEIDKLKAEFESNSDPVARVISDWMSLSLKWVLGQLDELDLHQFLIVYLKKRRQERLDARLKDDRAKEQESGSSSETNRDIKVTEDL